MIVMLSNPVKLEPTAPLHWRTCKVYFFYLFLKIVVQSFLYKFYAFISESQFKIVIQPLVFMFIMMCKSIAKFVKLYLCRQTFELLNSLKVLTKQCFSLEVD